MSLEILAPAGSKEALQAAVRCGTDAVYLGASSFNARRNADNFDSLSLSDAVRYCHARKVRVYVTLNTLIFNSEISKFISCYEEVLDAGPDCVIVQDLGALHLIRSICPDIPVCASTQMAVCNADGAKTLEDLGVRQAVLARELSLDEIAEIHAQSNIRLEAFVHGAHCMSVSGICYFSSALGERSGNRGLCAQPCRMDFKCKGRDFALSLKDLSFVSHAKEMEEAGICALKIEGRMKRPEYVAAAVTEVKKAVQGLTPNMEDLKRVFSRSGFTDGYLVAKRNVSMFGIRSQEDISASKDILGRMASLYRNEYPGVPINMELCMNAAKISLTVSDSNNTVRSESDALQGETGVMTKEIAERCLRKTGGTPYFPENIKINIEPDLRIPSSVLNALRKQTLEELLKISASGINYERTKFVPEAFSAPAPKKPELRARFSKASQVVFPEKFSLVTIPIEEISAHKEMLDTIPHLCAELPTVIWQGGESKIKKTLEELFTLGLRDVTAGNIGHFHLLRGMGFRIHGDSTLNIANSYSLRQYENLGIADSLLSNELTINQAEGVNSKVPTGYRSYGRLPLMFFRSCPARTEKGCEKCEGKSEITDKFRASFPIICHQKQYSVMHNSVPLYLGDAELPAVDFIELYFTVEEDRTIKYILDCFEKRIKPEMAYTRGHAFNGVR